MITQRQVRSLMLKYTNFEETTVFIDWVFNFINPKFSSEGEREMAMTALYEFAKECELTASEMKEALQMASKGFLTIDDGETWKKIKLFREIDRLKLDEVEQAYIQFRNTDYNHQKGLETLKVLLNPPPAKKEASEEEKWQHFVEGLTADFQYFTEHKKLNFGITRHYKTLFKMGVLPTHNEAFREQITERTFRALQEDLAKETNRNYRKSIKQIIENQMTDEAKFRTKAQEIIIRDFFQQLINNQQDITEIINRFGS